MTLKSLVNVDFIPSDPRIGTRQPFHFWSRAHPAQEADEAQKRMVTLAKPFFDEFLVMRYQATNESPFPFQWDKPAQINQEYGAILTRVSSIF